MTKDTKKLIEILIPYCRKIRYGGKHYICYPKDTQVRTITFSAKSSDINQHRQVFREFRRCGIIIKKLQKL